MTGFFVTGTDTGVGKTRISIGLIERLKQQGKRVACMKPIASGCERTAEGLRNDDALELMQRTNIDVAYDLVNPYAFEPAIAPHIAAKQAGIAIDLTTIAHRYKQIQQQAEVVVVEGAGGWAVPVNDQDTMADVSIALGLPVILIVGIRLGCINHALLTTAAIEQSGLSLYCWIANHIEHSTESQQIISSLKASICAPCLGNVPTLSLGKPATNYLQFAGL